MKRKLAIALLFAGTPLAADEVPPWSGYWVGPGQDCAFAGEMAEEMPIEITPQGEFGMEYSCDLTSVEPIGIGQSWKVTRVCMDAGFEEHWPVIFVLNQQDELVVIDDFGVVITHKRCAKIPE